MTLLLASLVLVRPPSQGALPDATKPLSGQQGTKGTASEREVQRAINVVRNSGTTYTEETDRKKALRTLWASRIPSGVAFLRRMVLDEGASDDERVQSLAAICAHGTDRDRDFAATVVPKRALLPPIMDRIAPGGDVVPNGGYVRGSHKDPKTGKTYDLLSSFVLGGGVADLFVAEKDGERWKDPVFLGVAIGTKPIGRDSGLPERFWGVDGLDFFGKGLWKGLIGDPALRTDADGDGLPDQLEARLGTDPNKRDSDGDGDDDLSDPWPLIARRPASDEEAVLAGAPGYGFFRQPPACPLVWTNELEPFELWGWPGIGLHGAGAAKGLDRFGYFRLTFLPAPGRKGNSAADLVQWSANHAEATVRMRLQVSEEPRVVREIVFRRHEGAWLPVRYAIKPY